MFPPLGAPEITLIVCFSGFFVLLGLTFSSQLREFDRFDRILPAARRAALFCGVPISLFFLLITVIEFHLHGWIFDLTDLLLSSLGSFLGLIFFCGLSYLLGTLIRSPR